MIWTLACALTQGAGGLAAVEGQPAQDGADAPIARVVPSVEVDVHEVHIPEGGSRTFGVRLFAQPASQVVVTTTHWAGDTDIAVGAGATLTFTPQNWNVWQSVEVTAAQDADARNGIGYVVVSAPALEGGSPTISFYEVEDDGVTAYLIESEVTIDEGGTRIFHVALSHAPAATVVVNVAPSAGDTSISVGSGASLTFTPDAWSQYQAVQLVCAQDADEVNGTATITCQGIGVAPAQLTVHERDDDPAVAIVVSEDSVTVPEGGSTSFTVRLSRRPSTEVTVLAAHQMFKGMTDPDIRVGRGAMLNFTPDDWDVPQGVLLTADEDADVVNGRAAIAFTAPDCTSGMVVADEIDNDVLAVLTTVASLTVPEGGTATFGVRLSHPPPGSIQVHVQRGAEIDADPDISVGSVSPLNFTPENWNVDQQVTLAAAQDGDAFSGQVTILCLGSHEAADAEITAIEADDESSLRIDFKPPRSRAARGWLGDDGLVFADRGAGLAYGWSSDISATGKERDQADSQVRDTFLQPQFGDPDATWRIAVPNGDYEVTVGAGDPAKAQGRYQLTVEGETVIDHVPTRRRRHADGTVQVTVDDGFLDLGNGPDADGNKVQGIEIVPIPPAPSGAG